MVLFLFLSHLALGIVFTLVLVSREAGVKFFRFNAGMAAMLIAFALAFRPGDDPGAAHRVGIAALLIAEAAVVLYWATVGRALASIRPAVLAVACLFGLVALASQAMAAAEGQPAPRQALAAASFISSAAFLGSACTAMVLGHWYLVIPSLQGRHLQRIVKLLAVWMVVRVAIVAAAVVVAIASGQAGLEPGFRQYILSVSGVFFWQRVLFGLAGPAVLLPLVWQTAKIQSTQSATGILYVYLFVVIVGEALAKYLFLATRVPV